MKGYDKALEDRIEEGIKLYDKDDYPRALAMTANSHWISVVTLYLSVVKYPLDLCFGILNHSFKVTNRAL